ncbi:MAG TPA: DNA topoisomerase IB [Devosia sp.]
MPRLRHVSRDDLTIVRRRQGRGYVFADSEGHPFGDAAFRSRVKHLGIPPAWREVKVAADPLAHIQACGLDDAGRVQYIYHPDWEARRTRRKQRQLALLASALPRIRRRVREDLGAETGSKQLALAIGVALIDRTAMRVGRERYLDAHGTRGAGTMFTRDVKVKGEKIAITFPAKSGKTAVYELHDPMLADAIARVKTIPGTRLLMYRDADGSARAIRTEELNRYLREIAGAPVTAKDFRTLHASALAAEALAKLEPGESPTARKRQVTGVTRQVAAFLQNTPAISRQSYIAPCLFTLFDTGKLATLWAAADTRNGLRQREARLEALLHAVS